MTLKEYRRKRDFRHTSEPKGRGSGRATGNSYVIQKHAARRLHYDFRLELDGVLKSWAIPKGPSLNPAEKRLAVQVEDHPLAYGSFEGIIPEGQYGGGAVMLWDRGRWEGAGDVRSALAKGQLKFKLSGEKLKGGWALVRMRGRSADAGKNWLLIKENDAQARTGRDPRVLDERPDSVASERSMDQITADQDKRWESGRAVKNKKSGKKTKPKDKPGETRKQRIAHDEKMRAADLSGARKTPQPRTFKPQLAALVSEAPKSREWLHEIKFDGYRLLCMLSGGKARLLSRNGNDWTRKLGRIAKAAENLAVEKAILDGEVVAMRSDGSTDFQTLQNALKDETATKLAYYLFDLPYCDGYDLRRTPLIERKRLLRQLLQSQAKDALLRYSDHSEGQGATMYEHACAHTLEGIVSKRADSVYESKRASSWLKVKCIRSQEFVVGGYTDPEGSRKHFGALLLGYYDDAGKLVYCGRVGTGFNAGSLREIHAELKARTRKTSPFPELPKDFDARGVHWVRPERVIEATFAGWTDDGLLRQASFQGLREDKASRDVVREEPESASARRSKRKSKNARSSRASRGGTGDKSMSDKV